MLRKKFTVLLILSLMISSCNPLQIQGLVTDRYDNPVPGAIVTNLNSGKQTITDSMGRFYFENSGYRDRIEVKASGYLSDTSQNNARGKISIPLTKLPGRNP